MPHNNASVNYGSMYYAFKVLLVWKVQRQLVSKELCFLSLLKLLCPC